MDSTATSDVAVVTLPGTQFYTMGEDLEVYANGLATEWGLGASVDGRSVLLLVFRDDRELHLAVGTGFAPDQVAEAEGIVSDVILPEFRADNFPAGITAGVEAIATRILAPATAEPATGGPAASSGTPSEGGSNILIWIGGVIAALVALIIGANRRAKTKLAATPCPSCGKTGLTRERVTLLAASETTEGRGEVRTTCPSCGHTAAEPFTIAKREAKPAEKKSDGGGASGEW